MWQTQRVFRTRSKLISLHTSFCASGGGIERRLEYTVPVKRNRLGPREARCEEVQRCSRRGADGFHVQVTARTPDVRTGEPYPTPPSLGAKLLRAQRLLYNTAESAGVSGWHRRLL